MTPKITIAIPVYTHVAFLRKAIESVLRQTIPDWFLIISDDHSPDARAEEAVHQYRDARVRYCRNSSRLGMAGNFNRCLDLAQTDLVTLLHADDELLSHYCEQMIGAAAKFPTVTASFCNAEIIDADGKACFSFPDYVKHLYVPPGRNPFVLTGERGLMSLMARTSSCVPPSATG